VLEADVPWIPARQKVRDEAYRVVVGVDPLKIDYNLWGFRFNVAVTSKGVNVLRMLVEKAGGDKYRWRRCFGKQEVGGVQGVE
jgi:hypothetical protein